MKHLWFDVTIARNIVATVCANTKDAANVPRDPLVFALPTEEGEGVHLLVATKEQETNSFVQLMAVGSVVKPTVAINPQLVVPACAQLMVAAAAVPLMDAISQLNPQQNSASSMAAERNVARRDAKRLLGDELSIALR